MEKKGLARLLCMPLLAGVLLLAGSPAECSRADVEAVRGPIGDKCAGDAPALVRALGNPAADIRMDAAWVLGEIAEGVSAGVPEGAAGISSVEELQGMREDLHGAYVLLNDIDASATAGWNGGAGFQPIRRFWGELDGRGFRITGLHINTPEGAASGLFGRIDSAGRVRNLGLEDVSVTGGSYTGALAGRNDGSISNAYSTGRVSGVFCTGGLVGHNRGGTITDSYSRAEVQGGNHAGGLLGLNDRGALVKNCYSTGRVTAERNRGGLIGSSAGDETRTVNSFYDSEASGMSDTGKGSPKTASEMKAESVFAGSGWDFERTWKVESGVNDGYPFLRFEREATEAERAEELIVSALIQAAGADENAKVRRRAVEALGKTGSPAAVPVLIELLGHGERFVRRDAARALGKIGCGSAAGALIEVLLRDEEGFVRRDAARALGEIGDESARPALIQAAGEQPARYGAQPPLGSHEMSPVAREARFALGKLGGEAGVAALREILEHESFNIPADRTAASIPAGSRVSGYSGASIRGRAVELLAGTGEESALEVLMHAAENDVDRGVRESASGAVKALAPGS